MFQTTNQMGVVNIPVVTACLRFLEGVLFSRFEYYNMFFKQHIVVFVVKSILSSFLRMIWVWINTYENTIFRGMNIHLPAILMFTRGTRF